MRGADPAGMEMLPQEVLHGRRQSAVPQYEKDHLGTGEAFPGDFGTPDRGAGRNQSESPDGLGTDAGSEVN